VTPPAQTATEGDPRAGSERVRRRGAHLAPSQRPGPDRLAALLETLGVLVAPLVGYFGLRLRAMAPPVLPDPTMSSTYVFDPQEIFVRYAAVFAPTARLREGARVGFLVPARLAYLAFGAVPGFFVFRYILALVAIAPTYLLLRRLYGRAAGLMGIAVILTAPVIITAWGTDFPDSAVVSYLIGGLACMVMPATTRRARLGWLAAAAAAFTLAVWGLATSAVLVLVALGVYGALRLVGHRRHLLADVTVLGGVALAVTAALAAASAVELGPADYVLTTIRSLQFLSTPAQEALWHSTNWRWAAYEAYLLVPPALAVAWLVVAGRRWRRIGFAQRFVGATFVCQLAVLVYLQFFNKVQVLEVHYFSSTLWAGCTLTLALTLAELGRPLLGRRGWSLLPAAVVVAVAYAYEAHPEIPPFGWLPYGVAVAAGALVATVIALLGRRLRPGAGAGIVTGVGMAGLVGALLLLTVAPVPAHRRLPGVSPYTPLPNYTGALGGSATKLIDTYQVVSEIPRFVGPPAYRGEQLLMCVPPAQDPAAIEAIGIYHSGFNLVPGPCPAISRAGIRAIERRKAAQILVMSLHPLDITTALRSLSSLHPSLVRHRVLSDGSFRLYVWLVAIGRYRGVAVLRAPSA
jgi:hypothetical protein